jgi:hypothetical protein
MEETSRDGAPVVMISDQYTLQFPLKETLNVFLWIHMTDETCRQTSKQDTEVQYEIRKKLPEILHTVVGAEAVIRETVRLHANGFVSETSGTWPNASFRSLITYTAKDDTTTNVKVDIETTTHVTSEFIRKCVRGFITEQALTWHKTLVSSHSELTRKHGAAS